MDARLAVASLAFAASVSVAAPARADPRSEAATHFQIGLDLVDRHRWDSALAEFRRSNELYTTPNALENAAVCLRELGRYDEALDTYDELVLHYPPANRKAVDADMRRIADHVGAVAVTADVAGATVVVDDRQRGRTPVQEAIRVTAGAHDVRVYAEGRAPFEDRVTVAPHETVRVTASLPAVAKLATVRVVEARGRVFEVLVDGGVVGRTPWEGTVAAGAHTFQLRGEGDMGAPPVRRSVALDEKATVTLAARRLPGVVRVEPDPETATVWIDGRRVGRGTFDGPLASGDHTVGLAAPWREPLTMSVHASSEKPIAVRPSLERIRRFYGELVGGVMPGDDRAAGVPGCDDGSCIGNVGGARLGWMLLRHVGVDAFYYVFGFARRAGQQPTLQAGLGGMTLGGSLEYEAFDRTPLLLRLGFGAMFGSVSLSTQGVASGVELSRQPNATGFVSAVVMPEVRFGYRLTRAVTVDVGATLILFVVPDAHGGGAGDDLTTGLPLATTSRGLGFLVPITIGLRLYL
jgi:hypothetical protein